MKSFPFKILNIISNALAHKHTQNWEPLKQKKGKLKLCWTMQEKSFSFFADRGTQSSLCCLPFPSWKKWLIRGMDKKGKPMQCLILSGTGRTVLMNCVHHVWLFFYGFTRPSRNELKSHFPLQWERRTCSVPDSFFRFDSQSNTKASCIDVKSISACMRCCVSCSTMLGLISAIDSIRWMKNERNLQWIFTILSVRSEKNFSHVKAP